MPTRLLIKSFRYLGSKSVTANVALTLDRDGVAAYRRRCPVFPWKFLLNFIKGKLLHFCVLDVKKIVYCEAADIYSIFSAYNYSGMINL